MHDPENTTKLTSVHLLLLVVFLGTIPLAVLWFSRIDSSNEFCSEDILPFWSGEFPDPVLVVQQAQELTGFTDTCFTAKKSCTVGAGIYHPWSDMDSVYISTHEPVVYLSKHELASDLKDYPSNTEIIWEGYVNQEKCALRIGTDRWIGDCPDTDSMSLVSGDPRGDTRQFFSAQCSDSSAIWLEVVPELFEATGITKGVIMEYGRVAAQ